MVSALAFSKDGKLLAMSGQGPGGWEIFDGTDGKLVLASKDGGGTAIAWSPEGTELVHNVGKLLRVGGMMREMLDETRRDSLDQEARHYAARAVVILLPVLAALVVAYVRWYRRGASRQSDS